MLKPGQRIFEYEVLRLVGEGGFAAVYEARDRMLDRKVAIKQLRLDKAQNSTVVKRFLQEARIAAGMEHPNVVSIHALRIENQRIYTIMEYIAGGSVQDLMEKEHRLPLSQAVKLTTGVCEGLAKLHAKGIIHRDIKAENILLTEDGVPKIIDFGIAHVPKEAGGMKLTRIGFQPSTVIFSSPEQFRGEKLDARSDVYQVGELIYYMLTGRHYIDLTELETRVDTVESNVGDSMSLFVLVQKAICEDPPAGLPALQDRFGPVADVIDQALAKEKEGRFPDTKSLASSLWTAHFNIAGR